MVVIITNSARNNIIIFCLNYLAQTTINEKKTKNDLSAILLLESVAMLGELLYFGFYLIIFLKKLIENYIIDIQLIKLVFNVILSVFVGRGSFFEVYCKI